MVGTMTSLRVLFMTGCVAVVFAVAIVTAGGGLPEDNSVSGWLGFACATVLWFWLASRLAIWLEERRAARVTGALSRQSRAREQPSADGERPAPATQGRGAEHVTPSGQRTRAELAVRKERRDGMNSTAPSSRVRHAIAPIGPSEPGRAPARPLSAFDSLTAEIAAAYGRLGHTMGWRFLMGPARTLGPHTRLAFVALNPGGGSDREYAPGVPSVERGNAFRPEIEEWPAKHRSLQRQVCLLYQAVDRALGFGSWRTLMDESLATNFCPFRCPAGDWNRLHRKVESIEFSELLWWQIFGIAQPRVIVCCGKQVGGHLRNALLRRGSHQVASMQLRQTGWGEQTYDLHRFRSPEATTLLVDLPHLSRFRIFGRDTRIDSEIAESIAAGLMDDRP
jgi:hypothetical protein